MFATLKIVHVRGVEPSDITSVTQTSPYAINAQPAMTTLTTQIESSNRKYPMRILFIGSPGTESEWLCKALRESTHSVLWSTTFAAGVRSSQDEVFDVMMLIAQSSAPLMGLDEVIGDIRKGSPDAVFSLVVKASSADERVAFLKSGIDVCFSKPWSFVEMHEKILTLHRTTARAQRGYRDSESCLKLDAQTRELVDGTARLAVTKREFLVLECLLRNVGRPVKHEQLLRYAWCDEEESDIATIPPLIWRLRRKIQGSLPDVSIVTEQAYGYRLAHPGELAPRSFRTESTTAEHRAYA